MNRSVKRISITALGIAMYIVFTAFFRIPFFQNYYLAMGYLVIAVYCYSIGLPEAVLTGFLGTVLYCLLFNSINGLPGWSLGNALISFCLYQLFQWYKNSKKGVINTVLAIVAITLITALGIIGIKSVTEVFLYRQPLAVRVFNNSHAFVADAVTLYIGFAVAVRTDGIVSRQINR